MKTLIIALGGNALIKPGERGTPEQMINNLRAPIKQIAKLSENYNIIIVHGNGPQSFVFDQAENRLHSQKAIMLFLRDKF